MSETPLSVRAPGACPLAGALLLYARALTVPAQRAYLRMTLKAGPSFAGISTAGVAFAQSS